MKYKNIFERIYDRQISNKLIYKNKDNNKYFSYIDTIIQSFNEYNERTDEKYNDKIRVRTIIDELSLISSYKYINDKVLANTVLFLKEVFILYHAIM